MSWRGCRCWQCWHRRRKGRDSYRIHLSESSGYCVDCGLIGIEACPLRFGRKVIIINNVVAHPLSIFYERRKNRPCCYPVLYIDSWDVRQRRVKDTVFGLKRFLGGEVTRCGGVNLLLHCSGGCV